MKTLKRFLCTFGLSALLFSAVNTTAGGLDDILGKDVDASADSLSYIGSNIVAKGHVVVRYKDMMITAERALINIKTKDIEAMGNVIFIRRDKSTQEVDSWELADLRRDPDQRVIVERYITKPTGKQLIEVTLIKDMDLFKTDHAMFNMNTGIIKFGRFQTKTDAYYCIGKSATRDPSGKITIKDARITTCEYLMDDHEHYSVDSSTIYVEPKRKEWIFFGRDVETSHDMAKSSKDVGEHSIWAYWTLFRIGGVPILPIPFFYKPPDPPAYDIQIRGGENSDWGYFLLVSKRIQLLDMLGITDGPKAETELMLDFYEKRGIGAGQDTEIATDRSRTQIFSYAIHDRNPYGADDDKRDSDGLLESEYFRRNARLKTPSDRFDLKLTHLNHITPRLDFRGQFEMLSDVDFLKDFFEQRSYDDPQPATFGALEYQHDYFSAALLFRPRVNDFFTVVEQKPEFRLEFPRQELFANIYHQGEFSMGHYKMRWRDYDRPRGEGNNIDPSDYKTFRVDTAHIFYYPLKLDWLNFIPRAGVRVTHYGRSSKTKIRQNDLETMFIVDDIDGHPEGDVINYDHDGGDQQRFVFELGWEANTKIYQTWQDVKSPFWELDGLRHVMVPYINHNYIPRPTESRNQLFYFDDIDRINEQHFIRLGLKNRLQTRRGNYGAEEIYEWLSVENYIDYHFEKEHDFEHVGDFGTILTFSPFPDLTFTSELLIDAGGSKDDPVDTLRGLRWTERKGLKWKYINKFNASLTYQILPEWTVTAAYNYTDGYRQRSIYSMGSSLTTMNAGSSFNRYFSRSQTISLETEFPIPSINSDFQFVRDGKTYGELYIDYDFEAGFVREKRAAIKRKLHCWTIALEISEKKKRDHRGDKETKHAVMGAIYLTALPSVKLTAKQDRGGGD